MSCCANNLGNFPHNEDIDTGLSAYQIGIHVVKLFFNGTVITRELDLTYYEEIVIPKPFNEDHTYQMEIVQPDGTLYEFDDCSVFVFKVYLNINSQCGTDCLE